MNVLTFYTRPVNNAGTGSGLGVMLVDLTPEEVQTAFALNTFCTLYMSQAAIPHMPSGGRIVNIGSVITRLTNIPGLSVYGASKAAQEYLTGALAAEVSSTTALEFGKLASRVAAN
jgi:NAD(P)-dependent dehydrogenase (short-subunit alcohol dehydrogenase family)